MTTSHAATARRATVRWRPRSMPLTAVLLLVLGVLVPVRIALVESHAAPVVAVNSTGDAGDAVTGDAACDTGQLNADGAPECTLRAALEEANASAVDTVHFAIPGTDPGVTGGVPTIALTGDLPSIDVGVLLDATTQPGWVDDPIVVLDGTGGGGRAPFDVRAGATEVRGFVAHSFRGGAVVLDGATPSTIAGNWFGVREDGVTAAANGGHAVDVKTGGHLIGGPGTADGNVIVLADNEAIHLRGVADVTIQRNHIGVDATGLAALPNGVEGIDLDGSTNTLLLGNVISGNTDEGVVATNAPGTVLRGNLIGIGADGVTPVPNGATGLFVDGASSSGMVIGGTAAGDGNVIAHNGGAGIEVRSNGTTDVQVLGNSVFGNGGLGLDLGADGVTANDALDADSGTNDLLNAPEPTVTTQSRVTFDLDVPAGDHRIEVFRNPTGGADPTGFGEGELLVGAATITHAGLGPQSFTVDALAGVEPFDVLTLTTTEEPTPGVFGSTSEFSVAVVADDHLAVVNDTGDAGDLVAGDDVCWTGGVNAAGADACTLRAAFEEANASAVVDTVLFDVPTSDTGYTAADGLWTIDVGATALPAITGAVLVDGSTQPGYATNPLVGTGGTVGAAGTVLARVRQPAIALDNSVVGGAGIGLDVAADGLVLRGLAVRRFADVAGGGEANLVLRAGAALDVRDMVIGPDPTDPVTAPGGGATTTGDNVLLHGAASGSIGGSIIAWGGGAAVRSAGPLADGWTLDGLEVRGHGATDPVPAIGLEGGAGHVLTATLVAGNVGTGVADPTGTGTGGLVEDSTISDNGGHGVDAAAGPMIVRGSVLTGNGGSGVVVRPAATGVTVTANAISGNGGLGIDLGGDGLVAANDVGDGDTGANELLNRPVVTAASTTRVTVELDVPAGEHRLEVFTNPSGADPSGAGEGELFVHARTITHAGGGAEPVELAVPGLVAGDVLSLTTTRVVGGVDGSTSEFSDTAVVVASSTLVVNTTGDAGDAVPGDGVCDTGGTNSEGVPACTLRAAVAEANASANDVVAFDVPATEPGVDTPVVTIGQGSPLPPLTAAVTIDGSTQPGFVDDPVVAIDGSGSSGDLLDVRGSGVVLRSLVLHDAPDEAVDLAGPGGTTIVGSWIGLLPDGRTPAGSGGDGIAVRSGSDGNVIGGPGVGDGNVIAAAGGAGVHVLGDDTTLQGNLVGTDATGTGPRPNAGAGVLVTDAARTDVLGGTVAFNGGDGITVVGGADDTAVVGTSVHTNGGLGIDLGGDGVTANDAGDGDGGPNGLLNRPVVTGLTAAAGTVTLDVTLDVPAGDVLLQAFTSTLPDPSGSGEGRTPVASGTVTHGGAGVESFQLSYAGDGSAPVAVTATEQLAVDTYGSTSEFSVAHTVPTAVADPGVAADRVLALAPLSWWRLGELAGTTALDEGSLGNDGTHLGGPVLGEPGALAADDDTAVRFDGADDVLVAPHDDGYLLDEGAVVLWVAIDDLSTRRVPFSKDAAGAGTGGHVEVGIEPDGSVRYRQQSVDGEVSLAAPPGSVTVGAWHHLAVTFGGRGLELYVDGELVDSDPFAGGWGVTAGGTGTTEPITIGASGAVSGAGTHVPIDAAFAGRIDEVAVFGTQLLPADVAVVAAADQQRYSVRSGDPLSVPAATGVLANDHDPEGDALTATTVVGPAGAASFGLAADGSFVYTSVAGFVGTDTFTYTASDGSGTSAPATVSITVLPGAGARIVTDSTGNGHDGRPTGGMTSADRVDGRIGGALDLDGVDDRITVNNLDVLGDQLTLSAWVAPDTLGSDPTVLARAVGLADADVSWRLVLADTSATTANVTAGVRTGAGLVDVLDPGTTAVADGWSHVVATYDGARVVLWVDGTVVATAAHSGQLQPDPSVPLVIGDAAPDGGRPVDGRIDEVRVSRVVRSDAWIATTHATQLAPGSAVTLGAVQTQASTGWTATTDQARSGASAAQAPADVFGSWLTLDGVDEAGLEVQSWWRVNTLAGLDLGQGVRAGDAAGAGPVRQDETGLFDTAGFDLGQVDGGRSRLLAPPTGQSPQVDVWQRVTVRIDQADGLSATVAGVDVPATGDVPAGVTPTGSLGLRVGMLDPTARWWVDDLRVRRFVTPEPVATLRRLELAP